MPRPDLSTVPSFYHNYVNLTKNNEAAEELQSNTQSALSFLNAIPEEKWDFRYAAGKWSVKEMVQHMTDAERIFSYRALCFARGEKISLPGFDENQYAAASKADRRTAEELIREFEVVRQGVELLFASFDEEQLAATGVANNNPVSVNAIGFIISGHVQHHLNILRERYL